MTNDDPGRIGWETAISGAWPLPRRETGPTELDLVREHANNGHPLLNVELCPVCDWTIARRSGGAA